MESSVLFTKDKAVFMGHLGLGDHLTASPMVRYLKTRYDKIVVVCLPKYKESVECFYSDISEISIVAAHPSADKHLIKVLIDSYRSDHDIIIAGQYKIGGGIPAIHIPFNFYDDVGIPHHVFWDYFHYNNPESSLTMYNTLVTNNITSYAFVHNQNSHGIAFNAKDMCARYGINSDNILIINTSSNLYHPAHKFYSIAETFVNKPFVDYIETMINATYIILTDSSFFCMALHLPIKTEHKYVHPTYGYRYASYLWSETHGYNSAKHQRPFIVC